jgi:hypothetical protein
MAMNYVAIVVAALAAYVLGALWYSPLLFGKQWMKLAGMKKMKKPANPGLMYFFGFVSSLVMSGVLALVLPLLGNATIGAGLVSALWIWLGFIGTLTLGSVLWEGKPFALWILNNAYHVVSILIMAAVLTAWV